jgi:hypothetical protein
MTPQEAAALLAVAAAFDNRKPDADAAAAWALALNGLRFTDCREVVVAHYRASNDWLMPSHVIAGVRRIRDKRLALAGDPTPPPDLTPAETIAWLGDVRRQIADGEPAPDPEAYGELKSRHLPDLRRVDAWPDDDPRDPRATQARQHLPEGEPA